MCPTGRQNSDGVGSVAPERTIGIVGANACRSQVVHNRAVERVTMKFIDLHCDTIGKLYLDSTQHLYRNSFMSISKN